MSRERYFAAEWEWACCGGPLRVGDAVTLRVQRGTAHADEMRRRLEGVLPGPLTGVETHHDDGVVENPDEDVVERPGVVVALDAVVGDVRWQVVEREGAGPRTVDLGDGTSATFGSAAPTQAVGEQVPGTARTVPVAVVPAAGVVPPGTGPDLARPGVQVRPSHDGYVITLELS